LYRYPGIKLEIAVGAQDLKHVAYVEDDPDIREIARFALREIGGLQVDLYESGAAALGGLGRSPPDLILLDVMMPEMDGRATLRELRLAPETAATPVVFLTARVQDHEVADYRGLGAAAVLAKPFDPLTLADDVRAIWRGTGDPT